MTENIDADDANEALRVSIRDRLCELSAVAEGPLEVTVAPTALESDQVRFTDGTWIQALVDNQDWLRLPDQLAAAPLEQFVPQLLRVLGQEGGSDGTLTAPVLDALDTRLEAAVAAQRVFIDARGEDTATAESAHAAWVQAWEDEGDEDDDGEAVGTVQATIDAWNIWQFSKTPINLTPSYQRGDVWSIGSQQALIESILRGIPLPSIILLRPKNPRSPFEVVDGKQRLTALLRFTGHHPRAQAKARELDIKHSPESQFTRYLTEDYRRFRDEWKKFERTTLSTTIETDNFFPFKLKKRPKSLAAKGIKSALDALWNKYYTDIRDEEIGDEANRMLVERLFEQAPEYKVPVIKYTETDPRQIHEVFKLYNKQGVHLNAEELRNAIFHELDITRALLVGSGDAEAEIADVPFLDGIADQIADLRQSMTDYKFSATRYKRTKVLSWIVSTLLQPGGESVATAKHIDALLDRVQETPRDPLRDRKVLEDLFRWIAASVESHAAGGDAMWGAAFRNAAATGKGWQELQLVGSIVGVALVHAAHPDDADEMIESASGKLLEASATAREPWGKSLWARPTKSQNKEQWQCIASIATAVTDIVGADTDLAHAEITRRFGSSGVERLLKDIGVSTKSPEGLP